VPADPALALGTGDFTVETWVYLSSAPGEYAVIDCVGTGQFGFLINSTQIVAFASVDEAYTFDTVVSAGAWHHIAFCRAGTTLTCYLDGVSVGTNTTGYNFTSPDTFNIGRNPGANSQYFNGYISNLRIVKGTALYTATFTPPRSPLTAISGTQLLLNTTNDANFLKDSSNNNFTVTNNGTVTSSSFNPLTTGSLVFNGTSQYLNTPSTSAFAFGTSDFTMETWIYPNSLSGRLWYFSSDSDNVDLNSNGGIYYFGVGGVRNSATNTVITVGTWHHIALVRASGTLTLYVNGVSVMSQSGIGFNSTANRSLDIAYSAAQGNNYFNGRMSNFRIISGTALYTGSTITVPTAPLSAISGTQLLLNTTNDANFLKDSSNNNFTITNNGSVTSSALNPF
jgi:hypothetical protein